MGAKTTISVVIPVYNGADTLPRCLMSILKQSSMPDEIIIANDASKDQTLEVVRTFRSQFPVPLHVVSLSINQGAAAARNKGIHHAKCDWIAFLDADDEWGPNRMAALRSSLERADASVVAVANDEFEGPTGGPWVHKELHKKFHSEQDWFLQLYRRCFLSTSAMAVKKSVLLVVKGMDETLPSAQDYDLWLRISQQGKLLFIPEPHSYYILREGSISANYQKRYQCMLKIIDKYRRNVPRRLYLMKVLIVHYEILKMCQMKRQFGGLAQTLAMLPFQFCRRIFY